ncbi:hypothetical protein ABDK56_12680 [Sphingomonas sp. ASV193]|uniref:hypothetical protein n=1 Tax=Sphingomonas sp. ASV193 TaxID=3144405 RepID=UPI0032E8FA5D
MPRKTIALGIAAVALAAGAALAQQQQSPQSILPPGFGEPAKPAAPAQAAPANPATPAADQPSPDASPVDDQVVTTSDVADTTTDQPAYVPQAEYPAGARRDPDEAGVLDPETLGLGAQPWGRASGGFLEILLRRMDTPLASRWGHIALRDALMVKGPPPGGVSPADWVAERAWLLLRMGEADAARLVMASIDTDQFTPKAAQVAEQVALATSDPSALCAIKDDLAQLDKPVAPMIGAMCAALSGSSEQASADIDQARRRGRLDPIDLSLADKVVGASADTSRAVTIEWDPVTSLNAWRYGLATATGMMPPDRLVDAASPQLKAWLARSPIFPAAARLNSARVAAALGVFSSDAYVDLLSAVYDATDPDELANTDAWKLRQAYVGKDDGARLDAMRDLWRGKQGDNKGDERLAAQLLTARAATLITPDKKWSSDAPDLVAAMLGAGFDRQAARWFKVVEQLDDKDSDRVWAMLALGAPDGSIEVDSGRIDDFAGRDDSKDHQRTALLVAGLAGLGRIDAATAGRFDSKYGLGLAQRTKLTSLVDGAAARRQAGTAVVLAATSLQAPTIKALPALYFYHAVHALRVVGQGFDARMVAAEALARA